MKNPEPPIKPDRNRYKSVADYAKLCGRTPATIRARRKAGHIELITHVLLDESEQQFVDMIAYPPVHEIPAGRKPGRGGKSA